MRKFLRNSILEIFQTLYKAHKTIKVFIKKKDYESAQIILVDCQNTAIQLGEAIENSEGEGFVTISYLEEYCEMLYSVSTSICDGYNGNEAQKNLDKALIKAENSVKNDIKVKLEIVFLPYKASMWDSLESVWKAANDDPDCNAHVIPIPYYDRKPDHSFGEMHYEGAEYPDYVPITHYQAYDLEKMRPDVIYIHNPYDEYNFVTCVMECFYSSKIKKYTDKLVYIPYFVFQEISPHDTAMIKSIEHFITTPAVINADRVIVQSEDMRQIYINVLLRALGNTSANRSMLEKKILGLGSPKLDKVVNTTADDLVIPEGWRRVLFTSEGARKRTVMYNSGVSAMLEQGDKWLDKIENVLNVFKRHSNEIAVIWRPHPLIEATMKSMHPHMLDKYLSLKNQYIDEQWGIFDTSADLDRAVILSDAFYGDGSSVTELYTICGKPALISDASVQNYRKDRKFFLSISDYVTVNGIMYCISLNYNMIFLIDAQTFEMLDIIKLKGDYPKKNFANEGIFLCDNYIIITTYTENKIYLLDINDGDRGNIKCIPTGAVSRPWYCGRDGKNILMFARNGGGLIKLNTDKLKAVPPAMNSNSDVFFVDLFTDKSGSYSAQYMGNKIYRINTSDGSADLIYTGKNTDCFCNVFGFGKLLILTHYDKPDLTLLDMETCKRTDIVDLPPDFVMCNNMPYSGITEYNGDMFIFPRYSNMILKLSVSDMTLKRFGDLFSTDECEVEVYSWCVKNVGGSAVAFNFYNNSWDMVNLETAQITRHKVIMNDEQETYLANASILDTEGIPAGDVKAYLQCENPFITQDEFLYTLLHTNKSNHIINKQNAGEVIHKAVLR